MPSTKIYATIASTVIVGALGIGTYITLGPKDALDECGGGIATGATTIGGPFTLVSETGATVTDTDVIDRPTLVYFGYTFCPDVCPVDAANMAAAADILSEQNHDVRTTFITIDPARDTSEVLADFTDNLHPDMLGLTGSDEQIERVAKSYRAYYQRASGEDEEFYLMDHSAFIYLMAPETGFLAIFRRGHTPDDIAATTA